MSEGDVARAADADVEEVPDAAAGIAVEGVVPGLGAERDDRLGQADLRAMQAREVDTEKGTDAEELREPEASDDLAAEDEAVEWALRREDVAAGQRRWR